MERLPKQRMNVQLSPLEQEWKESTLNSGKASIVHDPETEPQTSRIRNSSMDSIIPIIVTKDGGWRGAANSTVQPTDFN